MCYLIISESSQSELEHRVSRKLNERWELVGGVNVCFVREFEALQGTVVREFLYSQALSKAKAPLLPQK